MVRRHDITPPCTIVKVDGSGATPKKWWFVFRGHDKPRLMGVAIAIYWFDGWLVHVLKPFFNTSVRWMRMLGPTLRTSDGRGTLVVSIIIPLVPLQKGGEVSRQWREVSWWIHVETIFITSILDRSYMVLESVNTWVKLYKCNTNIWRGDSESYRWCRSAPFKFFVTFWKFAFYS